MTPLITSTHNPRVKAALALRERRERERAGLMLVEGFEEISLAWQAGIAAGALFYCAALSRAAGGPDLLREMEGAGAEVIEVDQRVFARLAYREGPDGWLATMPVPAARLEDLSPSAPAFLVVAEAVEKPGNLGAMLRTADAAGVQAVIAADPLTDWANPNVVRSSKGALFSVPVAAAPGERVLAWLREQGIGIVAATPSATACYSEVDLRGPVALAVGAEKHGLSEAWLAGADLRVRIPMAGRVNSLNAATAAALLIYEVVRQRGARTSGGRG